MRERPDTLLEETIAEERLTRFVWLRKLWNSSTTLVSLPMSWLASRPIGGERYFPDEVRDISSDRRLAILAVCVVEWRAAIADAVMETHDRIVGKTWREAERRGKLRIEAAQASVQDTLSAFHGLGAALLEAKGDNVSLDTAVTTSCGWTGLENLVAITVQLTDRITFDLLAHVMLGYSYITGSGAKRHVSGSVMT